jgi:UDPglucose--hexose-1-phosphate uridylyltransferase
VSEIRQDPTTEEWVIVARERAKRPNEFTHQQTKRELPDFSSSCPFCPGNESMTPPQTLLYQKQDGNGWQVRAFANKFAALSPDSRITRDIEEGFFTKMKGVGVHEVIVETPLHNRSLALMGEDEVLKVLNAYHERYNKLSGQPFAKLIIIFKNHGIMAGTSLEHSHSQLVVTPVVPKHIRLRHEVAIRYYDRTGRCLYSDLAEHELKSGKRIVMDTEKFIVFHPFASQRPFEIWILPKKRQASFGTVSDKDLENLAYVLRINLIKLYQGLNDPDFNYVIDTAPVGDENEPYYMWHMRIIPRLTEVAGFEIGSGIYINTAVPEETARFIRDLDIEQGAKSLVRENDYATLQD